MIDDWMRSLAGQHVDNKYILDELVGSGYVGVVYRARDVNLANRQVAVKLVKEMSATWAVEIEKVAQLNNITSVVQFHAHGACAITTPQACRTLHYTVWDYIPGRDLRRYLREGGPCSADFFIAVIETVLRVLHACERRNVPRHGDLHAGNILIGDQDGTDLDDNLQPRERIFVADFGHGVTGGPRQPKDDYRGLASIADEISTQIDWPKATARARYIIKATRELLRKLLEEGAATERRTPHEILLALAEIRQKASSPAEGRIQRAPQAAPGSVGKYPVSEMLGDDVEWWKHLFVPTIPARSRILEGGITTVVTGPRGCGKTMLFRRLSERLVVPCGTPEGIPEATTFCGFYVNANDILAGLPHLSSPLSADDERRAICYANMSLLSDVLAVYSVRADRLKEAAPAHLLNAMTALMIDTPGRLTMLVGENTLEHLRSRFEELKWKFGASPSYRSFAAFDELAHHAWFPRFIAGLREHTWWLTDRNVYIFVDDYTTPRISTSLQRALNRIFFQRSKEFIAKIATESATTFHPEDASSKVLQDGDDYHLIDMAAETLFMSDHERGDFLNEVFRRRLSLDPRVPESARALLGLLGKLGMSKTAFALGLRRSGKKPPIAASATQPPRRRGASRARALYSGVEVFESLWSGDTRMMIQLVQELVDAHIGPGREGGEPKASGAAATQAFPIDPETQDRVFRERGGLWLAAQSRNQPTAPDVVEREVERLRAEDATYQLTDNLYGSHLRAVVEKFATLARGLLRGPTYVIKEGRKPREVPRMAFRIEVLDTFRIEGLAAEIYRDLIRYGLFLRDARGKSVRGAMVPRLYLRRFLLPYATLALSTRDSVQLSCAQLVELLLRPDDFNPKNKGPKKAAAADVQMTLPLAGRPRRRPKSKDKS